jgi:hypothetical protein
MAQALQTEDKGDFGNEAAFVFRVVTLMPRYKIYLYLNICILADYVI